VRKKETQVRELNMHELELVSGGNWLTRLIRDGIAWEALMSAGPGPTPSNSSGWGVVGPGRFANTNPSSADAINGSDSMSDDYEGDGPGGFGSSLGSGSGRALD
jgi:hypothetical protein